jgi:hypothetical protein
MIECHRIDGRKGFSRMACRIPGPYWVATARSGKGGWGWPSILGDRHAEGRGKIARSATALP